MAHNCIDWTANPPTRKIPSLILSHGDDHVYTMVPKEFKTLEELARKEFNLGDVDIKIYSSCVNLCDGLPARITQGAWEHLRSYIGCATVEVSRPQAAERQPLQEQPPENADDERDAGAKLPLNADKENERSDYGPGIKPSTSAREVMRDEQADNDGASGSEDQHQDEEVSARKSRRQRRVVSEAKDEDGDSEREQKAPASPIASPPKPDRSMKQGKLEAESANLWQPPHTESQIETRPQAPAESSENHKLIIRVAHRPSQQESKFTTKGTTKVGKVLAGACKSFRLDASRATLYLIVSMEDEDRQVENLFPCDRDDTIARAGAERDTESRFLLKVAGEE